MGDSCRVSAAVYVIPKHELFGSDLASMRQVYEEVLAILQQGLSTGRITHHGERFQYDDEPVHFEMVQKPYPRFWYAGNLQRAAEQGMNGLGRATREMVDQYWQIWEAGRERKDPRFLGEDPLVGSTRHVVIAESEKEAVALARRAFIAYAEHFYCTDPRLGPHATPAALPMPGGTNFDTMRSDLSFGYAGFADRFGDFRRKCVVALARVARLGDDTKRVIAKSSCGVAAYRCGAQRGTDLLQQCAGPLRRQLTGCARQAVQPDELQMSWSLTWIHLAKTLRGTTEGIL